MQIFQGTGVICQWKRVGENRMEVQWLKEEPSVDLDEGAKSAGPAPFAAANAAAILLSFNSSDTSACFHDDIRATCASIHEVAIIS